MPRLTLNGESRDVPGETVRDLIAHLKLTGRAVAVEINKQIVPKRLHDQTRINEGDAVEVVTLVGGG